MNEDRAQDPPEMKGDDERTPGRRPFRLSMRALMKLPILIGVGIIVADRVYVRSWSQSGTELVEFRVLDESSGKPIDGATVALSGGPPAPQTASTRPDGTVAFAVSYRFAGVTSLLRKTRSGGYPWTANLSAEGYQRVTTPLDDHRPRPGRDFLTEQPIVIRLRPLAPH